MKKTLIVILYFISKIGIGQIKAPDLPRKPTDPCKTNSINISTGFNHATNQPYAVDNFDSFWKIESLPATATQVNVPRPASIINYIHATATDATGRWISGESNQTWVQNNTIPYVFTRCFCVNEEGKVEFKITEFRADDKGELVLEGPTGTITLISQPNNNNSNSDNFRIGSTYNQTLLLKKGKYCLKIRLFNRHGVAMGTLLKGTITNTTSNIFDKEECCNKSGGIYGIKVLDKNCNGKSDNDESRMGGIVFRLLNQAGALVGTSTSDENGVFNFVDVPVGNYTVEEQVPAGYSNNNRSQQVSITYGNVSSVNFYNCPVQTPTPVDCCSPRNTILEYGNIEKYEAKINSDFVVNQAGVNNPLRPGQYWVATSETVSKICHNWIVGGKTCENKGDFLVFNGRTGATGKLAAWKETVNLKEGNYKFCTQLKNFPQCCFDVKPKIEVRATAANGTIISSETYTVDLGTDPCKWLEVQQSFYVANGQGPIKIEVLLDQTGQGDGNDFAMNDAYLSPISSVNLSSQVAFVVEKIPGNPLNFKGNVTQAAGYQYQWSVVELNRNGNTYTEVPNTKVIDGWNSNPTMFNGYNGSSTLSGSANGVFVANKIYRFICTFRSNKECKEYSEAWIFEPNLSAKSASPDIRKDTTYKTILK